MSTSSRPRFNRHSTDISVMDGRYIGGRDNVYPVTIGTRGDRRYPNKADQAFLQIERLIVLQDLPPGTLVSEKQLMELTGLGRTPVREALQRLARERLVEIHPNRGVLVPAASIEAQLKLLECAGRGAVRRRLAAQRATPTSVARPPHSPKTFSAPPRRWTISLRSYAPRTPWWSARRTTNTSRWRWRPPGTVTAVLVRQSHRPASRSDPAGTLHHAILAAIAAGDAEAAEAASLALSDYLLAFAYATLPQQNPG